jgi:hypothetical protein
VQSILLLWLLDQMWWFAGWIGIGVGHVDWFDCLDSLEKLVKGRETADIGKVY